VLLGVFGIGSRLEAAVGGPGIEVGHGVHDAAAELAELGPPPITRCFSSVRGDRRR
jgi:hypothetical protein